MSWYDRDDQSFGDKYVRALGNADMDGLSALYADGVVFYTPFRRGAIGKEFILTFVDAFHGAHPGLQVSLHDEFRDDAENKVALRVSIRWHNTGPFLGHPPTGNRGVESEIHTFRFENGQVVEQWVAHNTLSLTRQQLLDWTMPLPDDDEDPTAPIVVVHARPSR